MGGGFIDRFSAHAEAYREGRPSYPAELFEALAAIAPARALAWDCGTGNGQAAFGLAAHFDRVHATDPSERQISQAAQSERIAYAVEPAERVSLGDGTTDLVLAAQALHWFDLELFYAEARRVLKPGGILAAVGYDWMYVSPDIDRAINECVIPPLSPYWAPQNRILWDGYRSIPFPGEEIRLGAFAIYLDWSLEEVRRYIQCWSAVRDLIAAGGDSTLASALAEVGRLWGEGKRRVVMPLHLRVARLGAGDPAAD